MIDWPYVHLLVNHVPIILTYAGLAAALTAVVRRRRSVWLQAVARAPSRVSARTRCSGWGSRPRRSWNGGGTWTTPPWLNRAWRGAPPGMNVTAAARR